MTTVNILQAFPDVAEHYRRRFRHVLVDEYQDTNHAQYLLVRELVGGTRRAGRRPATVRRAAGRAVRRRRRRPVDLRLPRRDDPQHPRVRGGLPRRPHDPARAELPLDADDPARRQRGHRRATRSAAPRTSGPTPATARTIVGYVADNEHDEAAFVADEIDRLGDDARRQARRRRGVLPHQRPVPRPRGGVRPGRPALQGRRRHALLRAPRGQGRAGLPAGLANPDDTVNLRRILNVPKRGIGDRAEACVAALAERERIPFVAALGRAERRPRHRDPLGRRDQGLHHAARGAAHGPSRPAPASAGAARGGRSSRPATSPSCARATTRRTRPGSRTSPSSSPSPRSSTRAPRPARAPLEDFLEQVSLVADADEIPDGERGRGRSASSP